MSRFYRSGRGDNWTEPRAPSDPSMRLRMYGRILPMEEERRVSRALVWAIGLGVLAIITIYGATM